MDMPTFTRYQWVTIPRTQTIEELESSSKCPGALERVSRFYDLVDCEKVVTHANRDYYEIEITHTYGDLDYENSFDDEDSVY